MATLKALFDLLVTLLWVLILIRVILTWIPMVSYSNPAVQVVIAIVDPTLKPFRRRVPSVSGIDFSPLLAIVTIFVVASIVDAVFDNVIFGYSPARLFSESVVRFFVLMALFFVLILLIRVLLIALQGDKFHPATITMRQLTDPLAKPFRGVMGTSDRAAVAGLIVYAVLFVLLYDFGERLVAAIH